MSRRVGFPKKLEDAEFRRCYEKESVTEDFFTQVEELARKLSLTPAVLVELTPEDAMAEKLRQLGWTVTPPGGENPTLGSDDPIWDGTDAAHPAWWRGCDYGVARTVGVIAKAVGLRSDSTMQEVLSAISKAKQG